MDENDFLITTSSGIIQAPAIGNSGTNYLVTFTKPALSGVRVTTTKTVLDNPPITIAPSTNSLIESSIASIGTNWMVVWNQSDVSDYNVYANRVTSIGNVLDGAGFAVCTAAGWQTQPQIAANGTNYLVVWNDDRNSNYDIYGTRVSPGGSVLDGSGFVVCNDASTQAYPAIASDGAEFFVAWSDSRGASGYDGTTYGTKVDATGRVRDTRGVSIDSAITPLAVRPSLASGRRNTYLICFQAGSDATARFLHMQRMEAISLSTSTFSIDIIGGAPGTHVLVESSSDLSNWSEFEWVTLGGGDSVSLSDTTITGVNSRFYRARTSQGHADTAVGFYRLTAPGRDSMGNGGFGLVAIQLENPVNNKISTLFSGVSSNTYIMPMNVGGTFSTNMFNGTTWTDPNAVLAPGAAVFVRNPSSNTMTLSFFGTIPQGTLANSTPAGYSLYASQVPEASSMLRIGYPGNEGDAVYEWNGVSQEYCCNINYVSGDWYDEFFTALDPGSFAIGDGFLLNATASQSWVRNFSVW